MYFLAWLCLYLSMILVSILLTLWISSMGLFCWLLCLGSKEREHAERDAFSCLENATGKTEHTFVVSIEPEPVMRGSSEARRVALTN